MKTFIIPSYFWSVILLFIFNTHAYADKELARRFLSESNWFQAMKELRPHAENGDPWAQFALGKLYYHGHGVELNDEMALKWFRLSAMQNYALGQVMLGEMLRDGRGMPVDVKAAVSYFKAASDSGDAYGDLNYAIQLANGQGVTQSLTEAEKYARKAAEKGLDGGNIVLGDLYSSEEYAKGDKWRQMRLEAMKLYKKAADKGNQYAMTRYAFISGVDDSPAVFTVLKGYAQSGNVQSQTETADRLRQGRGITTNPREAFYWYDLAANQGDPHGQYHAGLAYLEGKLVPKDAIKAMKFFKSAAENGIVMAHGEIGDMYVIGRDVEQNPLLGREWYVKGRDASFPKTESWHLHNERIKLFDKLYAEALREREVENRAHTARQFEALLSLFFSGANRGSADTPISRSGFDAFEYSRKEKEYWQLERDLDSIRRGEW